MICYTWLIDKIYALLNMCIVHYILIYVFITCFHRSIINFSVFHSCIDTWCIIKELQNLFLDVSPLLHILELNVTIHSGLNTRLRWEIYNFSLFEGQESNFKRQYQDCRKFLLQASIPFTYSNSLISLESFFTQFFWA